MCVEFLATGSIVTGMASGDIYLWKPIPDSCAMLCDKILMIPGKDPKDPKQKAHLHTVQVLKIRYVRNASGDAVPTLLSGGGGGKIKIWKDLDGEVPIFAHEIELPKKQGERAKIPPQVEVGFNGRGQPPAIKALDCFPGADDLVVGTDKCDVWKIKLVAKPDGTFEPAVPTMLVKGHTDDVNGIDVHPTREYLFASCAMSDMVYLWDANLKSLVGQASLKGRRGMCCAFRGDAKHLAIGTYDGCVYVFKELNDWEGDSLRLQKVPEMGIWPLRDCVSQIQELKYSPDLRTLAVASHDQVVDLYDCSDGRYLRLRRCVGHSATVSHLDWSVDSKLLRSQCNAYEVLYWNTDRGDPEAGWEVGQASPLADPRKKRKYGLQITDDQRDALWATWSCKFGFDVMGIWPSGYNNTDIKMVARSPKLESDGINPKLLTAAVDDKGGLMVFNYPTVVMRQPMHYQPGHSSFVMNVRWLKYKDDEGVEQLMLITAGGHDRALMQWRVKKLDPPKIDDPEIRSNEGLLMDAKRTWYYKYTGSEWNGDDALYVKYENIYKGLVGPNAPGAAEKAALQDKGGTSAAALEGGERPTTAPAALKSSSAAELGATVAKQEAELARQAKLIEDLQAQLKAKG
jgi:WD40 repeat protein